MEYIRGGGVPYLCLWEVLVYEEVISGCIMVYYSTDEYTDRCDIGI